MAKRLISILIFAAVLCAGTVAFAGQAGECAPAQRRAKGMVVNGTRTSLSNNLVGLISDSKTGKGIPGVPVTDGYTFTVTDKNGVYQLAADERCRNVYYSLPSQYKTALDPTTKLPLFYSTATIDRGAQNRNDFVLDPLDVPEKDFTLVMIGDPQCKTDSDVERFKTETLPDSRK